MIFTIGQYEYMLGRLRMEHSKKGFGGFQNDLEDNLLEWNTWHSIGGKNSMCVSPAWALMAILGAACHSMVHIHALCFISVLTRDWGSTHGMVLLKVIVAYCAQCQPRGTLCPFVNIWASILVNRWALMVVCWLFFCRTQWHVYNFLSADRFLRIDCWMFVCLFTR